MKLLKHLLLALCLLDLLAAPQAGAEETLVPFGKGSTWRYFDGNATPSGIWRQPNFDDSEWKHGPAPLGYGDEGCNTALGYGDDPELKHTTAYFRHPFQVPNPAGLAELVLLIRADDGFVIYLNGKEVARNNLPDGSVNFGSRATIAFGGLQERLFRRFVLPARHLVVGRNVLAVEVHQATPWSSDLFLDLVLRGYGPGNGSRPKLSGDASQATREYLEGHYVGPGMPIPNGFLDGGRGMTVTDEGGVRSGREIIRIDRGLDVALRRHLEFARSNGVKALALRRRVERLATYVDKVMSLPSDDGSAEDAVNLLDREYENEGVLLGEVPRLCGAGVCRHRALLFKILADEAQLDVALVRGNFQGPDALRGHAWNEVYFDDGSQLILDVTHRHAEQILPQGKGPRSHRYLTVENQPWYKTGATTGLCFVVAHRGLIRHAPENTLANFRACLDLRVGFEVDVLRTQDGHLACIHDETVDRTTDGSGKVVDFTLAELKALDAGSWFDPAFVGAQVPTLDEVFDTLSRYPHRVLVAMDLKAADIEEDVIRLAKKHQVLNRLLFIGRAISVPEVRQRLRKAAPKAQIAVVANTRDELEAAMDDEFADWVYVRYVPSKADVARIHEGGQQVFIAGPTVAGEERANWRTAIASGVDGVLTDYPLSLKRLMRE